MEVEKEESGNVDKWERVGRERKDVVVEGVEEEGRRRSRLPFPWYFPLLLVGTWITLCGWLFSLWEPEWGFLTSTYFVFMSLSTIGLGDVVSHILLCPQTEAAIRIYSRHP